MPDATTQTTAENWFDKINDAAQQWYGIFSSQNDPNHAMVTTTRSGISGSISVPLLLVGGAVLITVIYVWKKA